MEKCCDANHAMETTAGLFIEIREYSRFLDQAKELLDTTLHLLQEVAELVKAVVGFTFQDPKLPLKPGDEVEQTGSQNQQW